MRTFAHAVAALCTAALVAGLAWPHVAGRLLQVLVAALALSYAGRRAYRSGLPMRMAGDTYSPFEAGAPARPASTLPARVRELATLLRAANDPVSLDRAEIPVSARRMVIGEASRRLAEHRGLRLDDPGDHPRIRALVSEPTVVLLGLKGSSSRGVGRTRSALCDLTSILDDVEAL